MISEAHELLQRVIHHILPITHKETCLFLAAVGLTAHTAAFGLTMKLVPKYAREMNPLASLSGLVQYFPVTIAALILSYYWIIGNSFMSQDQKIIILSMITGITVIDFLIDFGTFVHTVGIGNVS